MIQFLCSEGMKTGDIYGMLVQYGDNCMSQRKLCGWEERFKGGRTGIDDARSGGSSTVTKSWG
jgi:hypothetical protein